MPGIRAIRQIVTMRLTLLNMHHNSWRPEPESNRRARICSPLRHHSAIGPLESKMLDAASLHVVEARV
jgi:hypothetical protein